jgi:hypothetical protein
LCWLNQINAERVADSLGHISQNAFEALIDRLEKEWFDLVCNPLYLMATIPELKIQIKSIPKPEPEPNVSGEDAVCAICDDSECENCNAIVFCDGCNLAVHQGHSFSSNLSNSCPD